MFFYASQPQYEVHVESHNPWAARAQRQEQWLPVFEEVGGTVIYPILWLPEQAEPQADEQKGRKHDLGAG